VDSKEQSDYVSVPKYEICNDEEGFTPSFGLNQVEDFKQFFHKYGFVVVRDIFTPEDCKDTIDDIWNFLSKNSIEKDSKNTWENSNWRGTGLWTEGIVSFDPIFTKRSILNRQNENLYQVFSSLLERKDLLVNHDRYGLFRSTKDASTATNGKNNAEDWMTTYNLHFDMNPWAYCSDTESSSKLEKLRYRAKQEFIVENNEVGILQEGKLNLQGLVNLADNREEDGGFILVPGFKNHIVEWVNETKPNLGSHHDRRQVFIVLPSDDPLYRMSIRITAKAGSCIIWDQRTVHGSRPNNSDKQRYAQFFKMSPVPETPERATARATSLRKLFEKVGCMNDITEHGKLVFGFN